METVVQSARSAKKITKENALFTNRASRSENGFRGRGTK